MDGIIRTQSRVYSNKKNAIKNAKPYSNFKREDIYVHETPLGRDKYQYTLRTLKEIFSPDSDFVIYFEPYVSPQNDISE